MAKKGTSTKHMLTFNDKRTFGVEIEMIGLRYESVEDILSSHNIPVYSGDGGSPTKWAVKGDGSLHPSPNCELVSPILKGKEGLDMTVAVANYLKEAKAYANESCGLHVHHGAEDYEPDTAVRLLTLYARLEPIINSFLDPRRRDNSYAKILGHPNDIPALFGKSPRMGRPFNLSTYSQYNDRYHKVNVMAYERHHTIEFRQHEGTVDGEEIKQWVVFTNMLMERAKEPLTVVPIPEKMSKPITFMRQVIGATKGNTDEVLFSSLKHYSKRYRHERKRSPAMLAYPPSVARCTPTDSTIHYISKDGYPVRSDGRMCSTHATWSEALNAKCWEAEDREHGKVRHHLADRKCKHTVVSGASTVAEQITHEYGRTRKELEAVRSTTVRMAPTIGPVPTQPLTAPRNSGTLYVIRTLENMMTEWHYRTDAQQRVSGAVVHLNATEGAFVNSRATQSDLTNARNRANEERRIQEMVELYWTQLRTAATSLRVALNDYDYVEREQQGGHMLDVNLTGMQIAIDTRRTALDELIRRPLP